VIRKARPEEAALLSSLAWQSKAHWGYSAQALEAWRADLIITAEDIRQHPTYVAETGSRVMGFYMLHMAPLQTLEHLWVRPGSLRHGVGTRLISHAIALVGTGRSIRVVAEPHAAGFDEHHGGVRTDSVVAPIPGMPERTLPVYELRSPAT
jgi:GNAT superfamily N-acetyltransferase